MGYMSLSEYLNKDVSVKKSPSEMYSKGIPLKKSKPASSFTYNKALSTRLSQNISKASCGGLCEKAARVDDFCVASMGVNTVGSPDTFINNRSAVRKMDMLRCTCPDEIKIAYMNGTRKDKPTYVNNLSLQRVYDPIICECGCSQGTGSPDVFVGA